jgi:transcription elongation factor Elf1
MLIDAEYTCPRCWETNTVALDLSVSEQSFIQDCEVCCAPIQFRYTAHNGELESFDYESAG